MGSGDLEAGEQDSVVGSGWSFVGNISSVRAEGS